VFLKQYFAGKWGIRPLENKAMTAKRWETLMAAVTKDKVQEVLFHIIPPRSTPARARPAEPGIVVPYTYSERAYGTCNFSETRYYRGHMEVPLEVVREGHRAVEDWLTGEDYYDSADNYEDSSPDFDNYETSDSESNGDLEVDQSELTRLLEHWDRENPETEE